MPLFKEIESLERKHIKEYRDERMEQIAKQVYPEVSLLKQVKGVGTQIALTYVLTLEDPYRFAKSREGGLFSGVTTWPQELWGERTPEGHQQRRRLQVFAHHAGAGSALHSWDLLEKMK